MQYRTERVWKDYAPGQTRDRGRSTKFMLLIILVELYATAPSATALLLNRFRVSMDEAKSIGNEIYVSLSGRQKLRSNGLISMFL